MSVSWATAETSARARARPGTSRGPGCVAPAPPAHGAIYSAAEPAAGGRMVTGNPQPPAPGVVMGQTFSLGRIFGIRVGVNWSVLAIVALLAYGLAVGEFPAAAPRH